MILPATSFLGFIATLTGWFGVVMSSATGPDPAVRRMIIRDEILIHVPIGNRPPPLFEWEEHKGPKCLPAAAIVGASIAGPSSIDFVLRDRRRIRAKLDKDCAGLDFYGGFYVEPADGGICAKREEIRSRVGASCRITHFRRLVPKLKR
ncbi:MAG: hypothetical protein LH465_05785 [Sphingomonas bacterium]|nr:hypothetical protein [Sphingomonas bacterium]